MTPEQQRALALARARKRRSGESQQSKDLRAQLSGFTQDPSQGVFDALPTWQKPLKAADDLVRLAANGMTFGGADRLAGYMNGDGVQAEQAKSESAGDRAGYAGTAAEVGGILATPFAAARQGATLAGRFGSQALTGAKGVAARLGLLGVEGEGYNLAASAAGDTPYQPGLGVAAGVGGSIAGDAISSGVSKIAGALSKAPKGATVDDFMASKDAAYKAAESAGVVYSPEAITRLSSEIRDAYGKKAYHPKLQPNAGVVLDEVDRLINQDTSKMAATLQEIDNLRQIAGDAFIPGNPKNNLLARIATEKIDDLVLRPKPGDVVVGDAPGAAEAITSAREAYHKGSKLKKVEELFERGEFNAESSGSGGNVQNATRQQLKKILTNKGWDRGFSKAEKAEIKGFVKGDAGQNIARAIGAMGPSGNGLGKMLWTMGAGGAAFSNPLALAGVVAGAGATAGTKKIAEALTRKKFGDLKYFIATGGSRPPKNAAQKLAESKRDAIARALMGASLSAPR